LRKLLIISFYFPPVNNPGALRIGKFAKYLPEFGWEPVVLTVDKIAGSSETLPLEMDEASVLRTTYFDPRKLLSRKPGSSTVDSPQTSVRSKRWSETALRILRLLQPIYASSLIDKLLCDPWGWYPCAVRKGTEVLAKENIDVIFSTYNPSLPHLVASQLHRKTGIPWVAEFRDLWALNPYARKTQPFQLLDEQWERRTMSGCDLLITISEPLARDLAAFHSKKTVIIPNGFDEDDYGEAFPLTSKFTITYTGRIYSEKRDPTPLFKALAELRHEGMVSPDDVEVRFFGKYLKETPSLLAEAYGIQDFVKTYDIVPFKESIRRQKESTVLLLLEWDDPRGAGTYTAKVFEYLGAGRPILATAVKGGGIDKLLQESGSGMVANRVDEIKEILATWLGEFKQSGNVQSYYHPDSEVIQRYSRKEETKKLAEVLNEVVNSHGQKHQS
jgi:glycosyltransferase involved in cell wall biosynthesis